MTTNEKVFAMRFAKVYPLLVAKAQRKGRLKAEVDEAISWQMGYSQAEIDAMAESDTTYREFVEQAPSMNPDRSKVKGVVCGVRVESVEDPIMREIRILDKLVDEIAKGKPMEKVLRK